VNLERMPVVVLPDHDTVARVVAQRIAGLMMRRRHEGRRPVLGLATGSTPVGVYRELIRMHRGEDLDFSDVVTFNLDEYHPMDPANLHSYHRFMWAAPRRRSPRSGCPRTTRWRRTWYSGGASAWCSRPCRRARSGRGS
jgi:hypothetical protein